MTPFLGSCQQLLAVLYMNNLQMQQNTGCFVWILWFSSQSLCHRISSPLPLLFILLLCSPGARWSCRSGFPSGDTCWGGKCASAGSGQFLGSRSHPEHPCCMGSSGFSPWVSGGRNEGSACAPFLLQPNPSYRQELLGSTFFYTLPLLPAAETSRDVFCSLGDNSRAPPEPSCWQISLLWETSQPFSVFWGALVFLRDQNLQR